MAEPITAELVKQIHSLELALTNLAGKHAEHVAVCTREREHAAREREQSDKRWAASEARFGALLDALHDESSKRREGDQRQHDERDADVGAVRRVIEDESNRRAAADAEIRTGSDTRWAWLMRTVIGLLTAALISIATGLWYFAGKFIIVAPSGGAP